MAVTYKELLIIPIISIIFSSCLAAGVPYTSNPKTLIKYGNTLVEQGRVWRAEELYNSSLEKYIQRGEKIGMAVSNIKLGDLYRDFVSRPDHEIDCANAKEKRGIFYNCPDYPKAIEHYHKAIRLLESVPDSVEKFHFLRISHTSIARIHEIDNKSMACSEYKTSLNYYNQARKLEPGYRAIMRDGTEFKDFVEAATKFC